MDSPEGRFFSWVAGEDSEGFFPYYFLNGV